MPAEIPMPSEPVDISTPGVLFISGWPCRIDPAWRNEARTDGSKNPIFARTAYKAMELCPFDSTKRSRSGQSGSSGRIFKTLK